MAETLKVTLPVEGMTCAACQATVQKALNKAPGVSKATVNLMTNEATVEYDAASTDPSALVAAINDTGYLSHLPTTADAGPSADDARDAADAHEFEQLRNKSLTSLALGIIAMVVSMPLMAGHHASDPLLAWQMRVLDPALRRPGRFAWNSARARAWRRIRSDRVCLPSRISFARKRSVTRLLSTEYFALRGMEERRGISTSSRLPRWPWHRTWSAPACGPSRRPRRASHG